MPAPSFTPDDRGGAVDVQPERDDIVALCLEGEFDMGNVPILVQRIDQTLVRNYHLIIDLSQATFIDSSVVHALVRAEKAAQGRERKVVLQLGTDQIVERLLEVTGIERVLTRVHTRSEAVQIIHSARESRSPTGLTAA
jgi:anti-anti-sigma factor